MPKKLGEILVERGLITSAQLQRALKAHLFFGGHLGTSLIELGYIDENDLGTTLSEMHRLPFADRARLDAIPVEVLALLPRSYVERYRVIPVAADGKRGTLEVAVIEPHNIGPLSSTTRYKKIVPWICPETRILEAMERCYGIPRPLRYISLDRAQPVQGGPDPLAPPETGHPAPAAVPVRPATVRQHDPSGLDIGQEFGYGRSWREVAGEIFDEETGNEPPEPATDQPAGSPSPPKEAGPISLERTAALLSRAETKDDLASAVLDFAAARSRRSILFVVKNETARLWGWRGSGLDPALARSVAFPVTSGSVFTLLLGNPYYHGPVPDEPGCRYFHNALRMNAASEILLVPVHLQDRLVAILYSDGGRHGRIDGAVEEFLQLAGKLSLGLSMLVLKMRIRAL